MRNFIFLVLSLTFGLAGTLHAEEIYKWTDENGRPVYSQHPPEEGIQFERINQSIKRGSEEEPEAAESEPAENTGNGDGEEGENGTAKKKQTKPGYSEEDIARRELMKEENCQKARDALDLYTVNRRFEGKDGQVVTLTDEQRDANIKKAEQAISEFCN